MILNYFFLVLSPYHVLSREMKLSTRLECEFTISTEKAPTALARQIRARRATGSHCRSKSSNWKVKGRNVLFGLGSNSYCHFVPHITDTVTFTLHAMQGDWNMAGAECRIGDRGSSDPFFLKSVDKDKNVMAMPKTIFHYNRYDHPEDCHSDEVGFPGQCSGNGNWCVHLTTSVGKCRCKEQFKGHNCNELHLR